MSPAHPRVESMPFAQRLRSDTSDLHVAVEASADLPGSVRTRADYSQLLTTFYAAQATIEAAVLAPRWSRGWAQLGIDIDHHSQLALLADDLASLGVGPSRERGHELALSSTDEALGCLYVLEGSAIGRRVLSPMFKQRLGDIPTQFLDGAGRHPRAWRSVQRSLACSESDRGRQASILVGARIAFGVYLDQLALRAERSTVSAG